MIDFLALAPQCCDASNYLQLGAQCAMEGICSGPLRPAANYYWFSIPYRLGLPPDILAPLNMVFMLLSSWLSSKAFIHLLSAPSNANYQKTIYRSIIFIVCLLCHVIFYYPILFNTLSDAPASSLFLCGIWLSILSVSPANPKSEGWLLAGAGLCWGVAAWLRAFFLYPVLCGLFVYGCFWLIRKQRHWMQLALLVALIPISAQYLIMYNSYGKFGYLEEGEVKHFSTIHLTLPYVGYDTYFPHDAYFWTPQNCMATQGILNGIQSGAYAETWCVLKNRAYFYLGTYTTVTYPFPGGTHYLVGGSSEHIGSDPHNWFTNLVLAEDVALAPSGLKTADRLSAATVSVDGFGTTKQWITLEADIHYTFSIWLWSPLPRTVNLAITESENGHAIVARQEVLLTPQPQRYSATGKTSKAVLHDVQIGLILPEYPVTFGTQTGDYLFAWGAQLEASDHPTDYAPEEAVDPDKIRIWRPALLWLNMFAMALACGFIIARRSLFIMEPKGLMVMAALSVCVAEAMVIIPEQRFIIVLMIFIWLNAAAGLHNFFYIKHSARQNS